MKITGGSDIGRVRRSNQDSFLTGEIDGNTSWSVVCDGMGGANGGNIASQMAVKVISDHIKSAYRSGMSSNSIRYLLMSAVTAANSEIYDLARSDESLAGMGTTVVATIIVEQIAHIVHAGDSRAYLLNKQKIEQITRDHSVVQSMIETGEITEEQAKIHPNRNVITRALGVNERINIDYNEISLSDEDMILICSDGLTNFVDDDNIFDLINKNEFNEYPEKLIDMANQNGGGDNITVVIMSGQN